MAGQLTAHGIRQRRNLGGVAPANRLRPKAWGPLIADGRTLHKSLSFGGDKLPPKLCAGADEAEALEQDFAFGEIHQRFPLGFVSSYESA